MRQNAIVTALLPDGRAEVAVCRKSACSGDCRECGGCGAAAQTLTAVAENPIAAPLGARVLIETPSSPLFRAAVLIYLLPLALFIAAYLLALPLGRWALAIGAGAFVLGALPAVRYDRRLKKRPLTCQIIEIV